MNFDLKKPCDNCPFLSTTCFGLHPRRTVEIATALRRGGTFACHKTATMDDDEECVQRSMMVIQHCAGAAIVMLKEGRPGQLLRIAERLGMMADLDMDALVYPSLRHFERGAVDPKRRRQSV